MGTTFEADVGEHSISLSISDASLRFEFERQLLDFCESRVSSRWPAIYTALKAGIVWPQLDRYLAECPSPWIPDEVHASLAQVKSVIGREAVSSTLSALSDAAGELLIGLMNDRYPPMHVATYFPDAGSREALQELVDAGLARTCEDDDPAEFIRCVPFPALKALLVRAGFRPPRGYDAALPNLEAALAKTGRPGIRAFVAEHADQRAFARSCFAAGFTRDDYLSVRTRANVLVSTLVALHYGEGGDAVLNWAR